MIKKNILILFVVFLSCVSAEEFKKSEISLETLDGRILLFVQYSSSDIKFIKNFYAVFEKEVGSKNQNKLVECKDGLIIDRFGNPILSLKENPMNFFGFVIKVSYPTNKKFFPGFNLDPYFESPKNVGDTQTIQWNGENKTFELRKSLMP